MNLNRFGNLEEKELRKRVFVGDSNAIFYEDRLRDGSDSPKTRKNVTTKE